MSLQIAAKHLAAHGRGPDTTLVHMTPKEVAGLQALAQHHGGSLTINPHTGLPEAGFLSSILPLVAGVGLTAMGMPAGMAALTVGGGTALATGDLGKGLMAGLGAYGGSGLAESLIGSGAASLAPEAAAAAANAVPTETAAQIANSAAPQAANVASQYTKISPPDMFASGTSGPPSTYQSAAQAANPIQAAEAVKAAAPQTVTAQPEMYTKGAYLPNSASTMSPANMTASQRLDALKAGATGQNLWNYAKANPLQTAGMLAGPLMAASEDNNVPSTPVGDSDRGEMANAGYEFDPGWANPTPAPDPYGREQRYNNPRYVIPKKAADGGAVQHFDVGGAVGGFNQTPALSKFLELQAARAAAPTTAPIDTKQQFADYLKAQSKPVTTTPYSPPVIERLPTTPTPTPTATPMPEVLPEQRGGGAGRTSFEPGAGAAQFGGSGFSPGISPYANKLAAYLGNMGILSGFDPKTGAEYGLSKAIAQNVDPNYSHEGKNYASTAGLADMQKALDSGTNVGTESQFNPISGYSMGPDASTSGMVGMQNALDSGTNVGTVSQPNPISGYSMGPAPAQNEAPAPAEHEYSAPDHDGGDHDGGDHDGGDHDGGDHDGGGHDARGGFLNHGKFDQRYAHGGGISGAYNLGSYSDGGRLLRGPGDGVSDSIPAVIGQKQPARLADGEFVIPARIVSEIGNGSTEAGARKLYAMMDKVQSARGKTVGKGKVAKNTRADRYLPA